MPRSFAAFLAALGLLLLVSTFCGCSTVPLETARKFDFARDTFAFPNELVWEYHYDENGKWVHNRREPPATYSLHCFVLARAALQFFDNARFEPETPPVDTTTYRRLIRRVVSSDLRHPLPESKRVVIPGYPDLRSFSRDQVQLLKAECGGGWQSYFQRGHWRMIFPFPRKEQEQMAAQLVDYLAHNGPAGVHVVCFPSLAINHAMVLYDSQETPQEIKFTAYDPNKEVNPVTITFDKTTRTFNLPANDYFPGGNIDIYQVYHRWNY